MSELPKAMREPRVARATGTTNDGWYYVNGNCIDICAETIDAQGNRRVATVRLYRKQLERALQIMGAE